MKSWLPKISPLAGMLVGLAAGAWLIAGAYRPLDSHATLPARPMLVLLTLAAAFGIALMYRVRPASALPRLPSASDLQQAKDIIAGGAAVSSNLALAGDKRLLFSASGRSFVMYGVIGRSWVALGDPSGPDDEHAELVRQFLALCDRYDGRPAFYRVDAAGLPLYTLLGLTSIKVGEEARVALQAGAADIRRRGRSNLRQSKARAQRDGCSFAVIGPRQVPTLLPDLLAISSAWLQNKPTREKRFSVGSFDAEYLSHFYLAVVRCGGVPVAFANLWLAADRAELMVDLMRRNPAAPYGTMDFLFAGLMDWGAAEGYRHLNLGLAPLSGFDDRDLAAFWRMLGKLVARHAGRFYNFAGLRQFKAKFLPEWRPKYLVLRAGLTQPMVILDVGRLAAGGLRGLISK